MQVHLLFLVVLLEVRSGAYSPLCIPKSPSVVFCRCQISYSHQKQTTPPLINLPSALNYAALLNSPASLPRYPFILMRAALPCARFAGLASKGPAGGAGEQGSVPDIEALTGRARAEAIVKKVYGQDLFDREAYSVLEEGTRENPIPILSTEDERIVGISLPDDAEVRWMVLRKNELLYDPDTCNYFALKQVRPIPPLPTPPPHAHTQTRAAAHLASWNVPAAQPP